ncbi:MAG: TetR/AcrR family transcriptional regulator [Bacteroidales bacterium]|jgi:AcrR family transcriptional regulator|nr:TetR/AcrR family transcriptional regulator [Bacteroidales bacterium]
MESIDDQKLREILIAAKELFWKHGFKRVSIEEVCREANVSKMTFYKHFKNKIELIKYLLNFIFDISVKKYREIMDSDIPFPEKVKKTLDLKMEQTQDISNEFMNDYMRHADPEMMEFLNRLKTKNLTMIVNDYTEAQKKGDIRSDIKPEFIMYFLNQMFVMTEDENLERMYPNPQDLIMEFTNFFFYGILPR